MKRYKKDELSVNHVVRSLATDVPDEVWREREARQAALRYRTLTQEFFGDPPAGFSAADKSAANRRT